MGRKRIGVRKASESSIKITFTYKGKLCREYIKLQPTTTNLNRAERHRAAILDAIDRGTFDYATTFPDSKRAKTLFTSSLIKHYLPEWLERIRPSLKSSTYATHRRIINGQLLPVFGEIQLHELKWKHVKEWANKQEVSPKTLNNKISVLRTALDEAVDDELIEDNPLHGKKIRTRSVTVKKDEIDPFTSEERTAILNTAKGQEKNLIQFAFWTGMRISELCALNWDDVDWQKGYIRVNKALTQAAKNPEEPKTTAGIRDVRLLPDALSALNSQKQFTYIKGEEIFQNPVTEQRWTGDVTLRGGMWKRVLRQSKVRYRYPYQVRHTWASMMLMAGEPLMWVAQQIGHTSPAFTMKTYARFIQDDAPDAGMKAAEKWASKKSKAKIKFKKSATFMPDG